MSEYTRGPMSVGHDGPSRPIILGADGVMLSMSKFEDGRWVSYEREEADCKLFAAAPELVEALAAICDGACWSLGGPKHHIAEIDAAKIERARKVLEAVKGAKSV